MGYNYYSGAQGVPYAGQIDIGDVMRRVYAWLTLGLAVGFGVSFVIGQAVANAIATQTPNAIYDLVTSPVVSIIAIVAYLGVGFTFYPLVQRTSIAVGSVLYLVFAAIFGFLISSIWAVYGTGTIFAAFLTTAAMFGAMSIIGYFTKIDLSKMGAILFMALIGLIVASLVNLFLHNAALYWIISYAGVVIFAGLTAWDTQNIRRGAISVSASGDGQAAGKLALIGAFRLFLDFINLFLFLLNILGGGRGGRR
jgi:FtsH-binding integral membrane protein